MPSTITKSPVAMGNLATALVLAILQLIAMPVRSQRNSIRAQYQRPDRIGGSTYVREERPTWNNNNNNNNNDNTNDPVDVIDPNLNLVLTPQCNPSNPDSFFSMSNRAENKGRTDYLEDIGSNCDQFLDYCDKKRSNLSMTTWSSFVYPDEFYDTVEAMYDRCFKSCAEHLPGGVKEFCSVPDPPPEFTASYTSSSSDYCRFVDNNDWTAGMVAHEEAVLRALNIQRNDAAGNVCNRYTRDASTQQVVEASTFFPRASPVVVSATLRCAARIQAENIVRATIESNAFPSNLHTACPASTFGGERPVCEDFATRMVSAGYTYDGFGTINEVTAVGYRSPESVIEGWLGSKSGHCSAVVKQQSLVVPTEVGIGYYNDEATGMTGHVMILAQRQL
mmetsp:Transcript_21722/g.45855  ORF Transcript_21722/g.45855 Transcript_21722/m.45855 type:complete len:392 (+) Transcript_21722:259-1434(+)